MPSCGKPCRPRPTLSHFLLPTTVGSRVRQPHTGHSGRNGQFGYITTRTPFSRWRATRRSSLTFGGPTYKAGLTLPTSPTISTGSKLRFPRHSYHIRSRTPLLALPWMHRHRSSLRTITGQRATFNCKNEQASERARAFLDEGRVYSYKVDNNTTMGGIVYNTCVPTTSHFCTDRHSSFAPFLPTVQLRSFVTIEPDGQGPCGVPTPTTLYFSSGRFPLASFSTDTHSGQGPYYWRCSAHGMQAAFWATWVTTAARREGRGLTSNITHWYDTLTYARCMGLDSCLRAVIHCHTCGYGNGKFTTSAWVPTTSSWAADRHR